ncbi:YhgE/Pip family protein [Gorillibacterium sp. sgz5001074]|uniref:YhgE/Pip family protein n=1 Tax=Gorillibacterium sp. sgz5001074 TaxID=3446695 RepID=UPI003F66CF2F
MKQSLRHFGHELYAIIRNKKVLISVTAVALIPLLYSFMFLWAFWDPYARMDVLPVAVVNQDRGATFEGKNLSVGTQFTEKLKQTPTFEWHFVSQEDAQEGLKGHKYYMAIEIPEDFSEKATKVLDPNPQPAVFRYMPNESANFLASQIGKSAVERMKSELSAQLTKTYTETLFGSVNQLSDGLVQAADGATKLAGGTKSVESGVEQIDSNLLKLSQGAQPLTNGAKQLAAGAAELSNGLVKLEDGADRLNGGLQQLADGSGALAAGAEQAGQGTAKLKEGLQASSQGLDQLKLGTEGVAAGLQQLAAAQPELAKDPSFAKMLETAKKTAAGADAAAAAQKQLATAAGQLAEGQKTVSGGAAQLQAKLVEAKAGSQSLTDGLKVMVPAGTKLKNGLNQVTDGVNQLAEGTVRLNEGAKQLADGAMAVADGTDQLSGKLKDASKKTSSIHGNDKLYQAFAQPVAFEEEKIAQVPNYGTGFAPYFLSLGLFVGALLLTIVFPVKQPAIPPKSGFSWFFGKLSTMLLVGFLQAVIMSGAILWGLGLEPQNTAMFFVFSILTSWTFMILIQMLVTLLADPGRFVAIVLLILQLTTSAGTFPVELIPVPLQRFTAWLPMTYTVQGYKAAISSGAMDDLSRSAAALGIYIVLLAGTTLVYYVLHFRRNRSAGTPEIGHGTVTA